MTAPNVIDTPLGMMDGFVKRSVLKTAVKKVHNFILFLTRSEIKDCEDIIKGKAGCVTTITNSAHYPNILVNDPHINEPRHSGVNARTWENANYVGDERMLR